ncbi:MAG: two-component regulator propeller domain-containing protein, partial [Pseudomonadota bacterium]
MPRPKPQWIAILLLIALCSVASAQELQLAPDPPFRLYSVAEGLNQKTVLAIAQDQDGYLWIGTFGGLNRFDGKTFESFTTRQGLRRNMIQALMVDSQNRLWAGDSAGGLTLFQEGRVVRTFDPQKHTQGVVRSLLELGDTLYLGIQPGGLRTLSLTDFERGIEIVPNSPETVFAILAPNPDEVYVHTSRGLERYDPQNRTFDLFLEDVTSLYGRTGAAPIVGHKDGHVGQLADNQVQWWPEDYGGPVTGVTFDDAGDVEWVYVNEQAVLAFGDPTTQLVSAGASFPPLIDQEGVLWAPMRKGLARYLGSRFRHYGLQTDELRPEVFAIHPGANKDFWFGTSMGLLHVDSEGTLTNISRQLGFEEKEVRGVELSADGSTLWVVHVEELAYRIDTQTLQATPFLGDEPMYNVGLALDPQERVWVGSYVGNLYRHDPATGDTREINLGQGAAIYAMDVAPDGWLWFAAAYRGLYRLNTRDPTAEPELV